MEFNGINLNSILYDFNYDSSYSNIKLAEINLISKKLENSPLGINLERNLIESEPKKLWISTTNLKDEFNKITKKNRKNPIFKHLKKKFYVILYSKFDFKKKNTNFEECIKKIFETIVEYRGNFNNNITIGFKEAYISSFIPTILKIKNVKIINILRDPKEIYVSRNFSINKKNNNFKKKKHPLLMIVSLCVNNLIIDKYSKRKFFNKYISLKFNDVIDQDILLKKINKKIGIKKFPKKIWDKDNNKIWKINTSGNNNQGNYGTNWKKIINNDEAQIINDIKNKFLVRQKFLKKKISKINFLTWTHQKYFLSYRKFNEVLGKYFKKKSKIFII